MRRPTRALRAALLAIPAVGSVLAGGCRSYGPVRPGAAPRPAAPVRVRYDAPRPLRAVSPAGDTLALDAVRALTGEVAAAHGDTLEVWLLSVNGAPPPVAGARVRLVPASGDQVEAERFNTGRTLGLTLLLVGLAAIAVVAVGLSQLANY